MDDWSDFLEELNFAALVPEEFRQYRPAVVDGLVFFLENLSEQRALHILAGQAALPADASVAQRLVTIARQCPALHKLGQVLARNRRLPAEFRRLLQGLESMPSKLTPAEARRMVEVETGPLQALGIAIEEPPLAEASVAVVVPFAATSAAARADGVPERGVCKLLKPGIEARLEEELDLLQRIGALLDERCQAYGLPQIAYEETFLEVRNLLAREVHLDDEQRNLREARAAYAGMSDVLVPEVYPFSTRRMTAMQRVDGCKVTEAAALSAKERRRLGDRVVRVLVARPLWSPGDEGLFHADPHAGNLFVTPDRKLALLDWSLIGRLGKAERVWMTQILIGALTLDGARISEAIGALAGGRAEPAALDRLVGEQVQRLRDGAWPGLSWLMMLMDRAVTEAHCRFGAELVMFRKSLQTLDGVVADIADECRADRVIVAALLRQLLAEWGSRAFALPLSRHFGTHLSNLDLAQILMSAPLIGSRQWWGIQADLLRSARRLVKQSG